MGEYNILSLILHHTLISDKLPLLGDIGYRVYGWKSGYVHYLAFISAADGMFRTMKDITMR